MRSIDTNKRKGNDSFPSDIPRIDHTWTSEEISKHPFGWISYRSFFADIDEWIVAYDIIRPAIAEYRARTCGLTYDLNMINLAISDGKVSNQIMEIKNRLKDMIDNVDCNVARELIDKLNKIDKFRLLDRNKN